MRISIYLSLNILKTDNSIDFLDKMSKRINQLIALHGDDKEQILDFLDELPVLFRSYQACLLIRRDNLFDDFDHSEPIDDLQLFFYIRKKITSLLSSFFPQCEEDRDDEDYYKIRSKYLAGEIKDHELDRYLTKDEVDYMTSRYVKNKDDVNEYDAHFNLGRFDIDYDEFSNSVKVLLREINVQLKKFLSSFEKSKMAFMQVTNTCSLGLEFEYYNRFHC